MVVILHECGERLSLETTVKTEKCPLFSTEGQRYLALMHVGQAHLLLLYQT